MANLHVMLDLETMSTESNAAILSIGAVKFDIETGETIDEFYQTVDARDCKRVGLHFSKSTVEWWGQQPRHVLDQLREGNVDLAEALDKFTVWYLKGNRAIPVWGCGAGFDNVIMENAYKAIGMQRPWKFWLDRCYRTMKEVVKIPEDTRQGDYHNALDDARHQTRHLLKIMHS